MNSSKETRNKEEEVPEEVLEEAEAALPQDLTEEAPPDTI
jgi:hypothetical protein